ncbi:MAG: hypothetical protein JWP57_225, partial [Spirosoma sp.]|nr:hypothetical protein [Spirosoma sp.]
MFRNYFKIAVRSLLKHKLYSSINILGLALGMACALLIGLWVKDELSYNRFLPDSDNIYYVRVNFPYNGEIVTNSVTPGPLQEAIAKDVPEVAAVTKTTWVGETLVKVGEKAAKEPGFYATNAFFDVFELPALYGNPKEALAQPDKIVISRKMAQKYFLGGLALGKTLQLNNDKLFTVGAIVEDVPTNTTVQFDWLINWKVQ